MARDLTDKEKDKIMKCAKELQSSMFRDEDPDVVFHRLRKKYGQHTVTLGMKLLERSIGMDKDVENPISDCINRCMGKLDTKRMKEVGKKTFTVDKFYKLCIDGYQHFMNDDVGRALPIVFLYIDKNRKIGVLPIEVPRGSNSSPMDYLKQIVYQENPDAYCFCGEASMNTKRPDKNDYKYGDIINDPSSKDVVIIQGNTKKGDNNINHVYDLILNDIGVLEFHEMKDIDSTNMESEKLP